MGDTNSSEPVIKPLNTHATSAPAGEGVPDILGTDEIKPLNTHATIAPTGEAEDKTDNTHATSEPAN